MNDSPENRLRIGVSSCLLGNKVRYNGEDKILELLVRWPARDVEWVAICPEVEAGLGVPRDPIELVMRNNEIHAVKVKDHSIDVTASLRVAFEKRLSDLHTLCGFIFKCRSPSCGVLSVGMKSAEKQMEKQAGVFAAQVMQAFPDMPVIEENQLEDAAALEDFLVRAAAYCHDKWRK